MKLPLDAVEGELARLWSGEARQAPRMDLMTLVGLVSEPRLHDRAQRVFGEVARAHPCRTIAVVWEPGQGAIGADVALHRTADGVACGDAIVLDACGEGREWLPEAVDRLTLSDLPVWLWWVGDLPDHDDLFERMVTSADMLVVDSAEMDLRDLEKLSGIVGRSLGRYALSDLAWIRLRALQDLVARFFDDEWARARLSQVARVEIAFAPRPSEADAASTQAALLFGWMAGALSLPIDDARWTRGPWWSEVAMGATVARFEQQARDDVPAGSILRVTIACEDWRFEIERQQSPDAFRWSRVAPGAPMPSQVLHVGCPDEAALLVHCVERPARDRLLETSLRAASRIVRPVAPRLSRPA